VTAAIKRSINNLYDAIETMDQAADKKAAEIQALKTEVPQLTAKKKSADLFSFTPNNAQQASQADTKALASRLDGAIAKVEKLLQEG